MKKLLLLSIFSNILLYSSENIQEISKEELCKIYLENIKHYQIIKENYGLDKYGQKIYNDIKKETKKYCE